MPAQAVEVQKKDEKKEPEVVQFSTQQEIVKAMEADPALSAEFIAAEKDGKINDFVTKHQKPVADPAADPAASHAKTEEKPKDKPPVETPDEEITVKVRKKDLGTYLKNRKPEEAVLEAVKGKAEADKTIDFLKTERVPTLERELGATVQENKSLKQQLADYEAKKAKEKENPPPPPPTPTDIVIPADLPEGDLLEPEYQKQIAAHLKAMAAATKALLARDAAREQEITALKSGVKEAKDEVVSVKQEFVKAGAQGDEDDEIVRMRKRNPDIFVSDRPESEIRGDFEHFLENLRVVAGVAEPIKKDGQWSAGIVSAFNQYHAQDDAGKQLREKCDARSVKPPEDMADLTKIEKVQAIRKQYGVLNSRTGQYDPLPYEEALQKYVAGDSTLSDIRIKARAEGQSDYEKALAKRGEKAHEVTAKDSADPADLAGVTLEDFSARHMKYLEAVKAGKAMPEERAILESICKLKGMSAEQINYYLGG
jgi:hypothetical protein